MSVVGARLSLPRPEAAGALSQARVARSEWTKLHSLRSTRWSLAVAALFAIGLPILFAVILVTRPDHEHRRSPLDVALAGVNVAQLAIAVLGVLIISGEYSTGMIRASFSAVPRRLPVLWAKLGVYAVVSFVSMLPFVVAAFFGVSCGLRGSIGT